LDHYLARLLPEETRSQIQGWVRKGYVTVNERPAKTGYSLRQGDRIALVIPVQAPAIPHPEEIPLNILWEDSDLIVIDKPAGMVCHTAPGVRSGTLVNALLHHLGSLEAGDPMRPGIVHRLDKNTSGVLVIAKNNPILRALAQQFKSRTVRKEYCALVYGTPRSPAGRIDWALGRDLRDRKKISVRSRKKREAVTHYQVEQRYRYFSLLGIRPETGRTHQIRVHLTQLGHPIVGDSRYGAHRIRSIPDPELRKAISRLARHFLHARHLEFQHPRTGRIHGFASGLPEELTAFLGDLT
jgi:23S rRNA pseudouridine1911/1915/1917 synthase